MHHRSRNGANRTPPVSEVNESACSAGDYSAAQLAAILLPRNRRHSRVLSRRGWKIAQVKAVRAGRSFRKATACSTKGALELGLWAASRPEEFEMENQVCSFPGKFARGAVALFPLHRKGGTTMLMPKGN